MFDINYRPSSDIQTGNLFAFVVLQLCCNQLTGNIPTQIGSLKQLNVVALQHNRIDGKIPPSLGNLRMLKRLDLSFNSLFDAIPPRLADIPELEILDVRNNTLSGLVPSGNNVSVRLSTVFLCPLETDLYSVMDDNQGLKRLNEGFQGDNNPGLCGTGFPSLRRCGPFDDVNINQVESLPPHLNNTAPEPGVNSQPSNIQGHCNHTHCSRLSRFPEMPVISGVTTVVFIFTVAGLLAVIHYRRRKQKIVNTYGSSEESFSIDQKKEFLRNGSVSPLITLDYSFGWDPLGDGWNGIGFSQEHLNKFRFNLEEVEFATRCFSEANLLGKTNFSAVYKGVLKDRSSVAIRSINVTSCKSEEAEFVKGLYLLTSLRHENLVRLRGFCFSRGKGECFLIYDFASKGNLSKYLDLEDGSELVLDWSTRISIINGIAKGKFQIRFYAVHKISINHHMFLF